MTDCETIANLHAMNNKAYDLEKMERVRREKGDLVAWLGEDFAMPENRKELMKALEERFPGTVNDDYYPFRRRAENKLLEYGREKGFI